MRKMPSIAEMERAFQKRDESYDGVFFVAVRTTGIFCRPSCPARRPARRNMEYLSSAQEAFMAGYRPCKRCRPLDVNGRCPEWVGRLLARVESSPETRMGDGELRAMSIDPSRARRYFRRNYGMTFQTYHRLRRLGIALAHLRNGVSPSDVAFRLGYDSCSGFRGAFSKTFGVPPGHARETSCAMVRWFVSPVGPLVAAATPEGVCAVEFATRGALQDNVSSLKRRLACAVVPGSNQHLDKLCDELSQYFGGTLTQFTVPLVITGTAFQRAVWDRLREIPFGETMAYESLARAVGRPGAQRAVGTANGANQHAIVIPCHRVVRKGGALGGYGGGLWRKQLLLDHERMVCRGATTLKGPDG